MGLQTASANETGSSERRETPPPAEPVKAESPQLKQPSPILLPGTAEFNLKTEQKIAAIE